MTTDLGLDWLSSMDIFGIVMCLILFVIAVRMKSFPFSVVSAVGFVIIGLKIFSVSEEPIAFCIMFGISAAMVLFGSRWTYTEIK